MSFTIAELIVETLQKAGVRRVYGLPGDSLNGLTDALRRNGTLAWEHVRHEESAAFAAAADAAALEKRDVAVLHQVKGFARYATRSVLSGRGNELIDVTKTNVTRRLFS